MESTLFNAGFEFAGKLLRMHALVRLKKRGHAVSLLLGGGPAGEVTRYPNIVSLPEL